MDHDVNISERSMDENCSRILENDSGGNTLDKTGDNENKKSGNEECFLSIRKLSVDDNADNGLNIVEQSMDERCNTQTNYVVGDAVPNKTDSSENKNSSTNPDYIDLKSVQKYAGRIKSFLGWESEEENEDPKIPSANNNALLPDIALEEPIETSTPECFTLKQQNSFNDDSNQPLFNDSMNESKDENFEMSNFQQDNSPKNGIGVRESSTILNNEYNDYINVPLATHEGEIEDDVHKCHDGQTAELTSRLNISEFQLENKDSSTVGSTNDSSDSMEITIEPDKSKTTDYALETCAEQKAELSNNLNAFESEEENKDGVEKKSRGCMEIISEGKESELEDSSSKLFNEQEIEEIELSSEINILQSEIEKYKNELLLENKISDAENINQSVQQNSMDLKEINSLDKCNSQEDSENPENVHTNEDIQAIQNEISANTNNNNKDNEAKNMNSCSTSDETSRRNSVTDQESDAAFEKNKALYLKSVRRFSREIVKDVIHSARSSIIEIFNTTDNTRDILNIEETSKRDEKSLLAISEANIENNSSLNEEIREENKFTDSNGTFEQEENKRLENVYLDEEAVCGIGRFRPEWLQKFATSEVYLFLYCIIGILLGTYSIYLIGTFSTLEKRFAFKSKTTGAILVVDDIIALLLGIFVGYFGGKSHQPRMIAIGMLMSSACCFVSSLPYFIYGQAQHLTFVNKNNQTGAELCDAKLLNESCNVDDRPPTLSAVLLFMFAGSMKGFGNMAFLAIGLPYLDNNCKKRNSPLYIAIALALRLLGPLVGFLMSSAFLKYYENPFDDPGFGPDDPRWIGAWWMGFLLQGVLLLIFTIPIAMFPRRLPGQSKSVQNQESMKGETFKELCVGLVAALKRLAKNPLFIFITINTIMTIFGHFGHYIMLPKYMENQFRLSASNASLLSGPPAIACIMVSTVLGGVIIWKYRPSAKILLAGMVASEAILAIGYLILTIPRCQRADMTHFGINENGLILDSICNKNCDCSTTAFTPFCNSNDKTLYFSPCYAGCTIQRNLSLSKESKVFSNCSCVATDIASVGGNITEGFCPDENCWSQTLSYIILLLVLNTIGSTFTVAHTMVLLRSVHPDDKSVALGTFETLICLFGFVPFPVTFGALVDSACLIWEKSCGETGNCWFYDLEKYNYLLHGASSLFCLLSSLCLLAMYFLSARVRNLYDEENAEEIHIEKPIRLDTISETVTKL